MSDERRRDASDKIALGALLVKAGLRDADRAFLLGALLEVAAIDRGSQTHARLKAKGAAAFGVRDGVSGETAGGPHD